MPASITRMCSNTYLPLRARGCSGAKSMTYPALCFVRPPFQLPFDSAPAVRQAEQVTDFFCLCLPHPQTSVDRQAGHLKCLLDGSKSRPHGTQVRIDGAPRELISLPERA